MERAQRQYQHVEPENRLVAAELERRWEARLRILQETETAYANFEQAQQPLCLSPELEAQFRHICQALPALWEQLPNASKKELLRTLVSKVILKRPQQDVLEIRIVWVSGHFSQLRSRIPIHRNHAVTNYEPLLERIHTLWQQGLDDQSIARILTEEGFASARLDHISPYTVQVIRMQKRWLTASSPKLDTPPGYLKIAELAQRLHVQEGWLYKCIRDSRISSDDFVRHPTRNVILVRDEPDILTKIRQLKQTS